MLLTMHAHHLLSNCVYLLANMPPTEVAGGAWRWLTTPFHQAVLTLGNTVLGTVLSAGMLYVAQEVKVLSEIHRVQDEITKHAVQNQGEIFNRPRLHCLDLRHTQHGYTCKFKNIGQMAAADIHVQVGEGDMELEADHLAPGETTTGYFQHAGGPIIFRIVFTTVNKTVITVKLHSDNTEEDPRIDHTNTVYP